MFVLAPEEQSFKWPVELMFPDEKGNMKKRTFKALFKFKSDEELKEFGDLPNDEFFSLVIDGFEDLKDSEGNEITGSSDEIKMLCKNNIIVKALITAYSEFNNGIERKN